MFDKRMFENLKKLEKLDIIDEWSEIATVLARA